MRARRWWTRKERWRLRPRPSHSPSRWGRDPHCPVRSTRHTPVRHRRRVIGRIKIPARTHRVRNALRRPAVLRNRRRGIDKHFDSLGAQLVLEDVETRRLGGVVRLGRDRGGTGKSLALADVPVVSVVVPDEGLDDEDFLKVINKINYSCM
jgi:hypothetical protein